MNSDCFAAASRYGAPYCKCLTDVVCETGKCAFYKTHMQFLHDLAEHNGTTDLRQIIEDYAAMKRQQGDVLKVEPNVKKDEIVLRRIKQ